MGCWKNWQQKAYKFLTCFKTSEFFHVLAITLLGLLLPLSFLLLARFSCYNYLLIHEIPSNHPSFLFSTLLCINSTIIYAAVSTFGMATLVHGLTGKITLMNESPDPIFRPKLYTSWILLCTLQTCVGLGIEGSIAAGIDGTRFEVQRSLLSRVIFFLGLHETTLHWTRTVVKPVVDDTIFGIARVEKWAQKAATAMSFGTLWWLSLRDEIESLATVAEMKRELLMDIGLADLVGWWLYYLTVTIGMVRVVKGLGMVLLCGWAKIRNSAGKDADEDKV